MAEAVIVEAVRSPVGKRNGALSGVHPGELSAQVLNGLVQIRSTTWRSSRTWSGVVCCRSGSRRWTSAAPRCSPRAGPSPCLGHGRPPARFEPAGAGLRCRRRDRRPRRPGRRGGGEGGGEGGGGGRRRRWCRVDVPYPDGLQLVDGGSQIPAALHDQLGTGRCNQGVGAEMIAEQWGCRGHPLDEFSLSSHEKAAAAQDPAPSRTRSSVIKDQDGNDGARRRRHPPRQPIDMLAKIKPAFKEDGVIPPATPARSPTVRPRC